jgi:hypothetical protein
MHAPSVWDFGLVGLFLGCRDIRSWIWGRDRAPTEGGETLVMWRNLALAGRDKNCHIYM